MMREYMCDGLLSDQIHSEDRSRDLDQVLLDLRRGEDITVVYYCSYQDVFLQLTGKVAKVDTYWQILQVGSIAVDFWEIREISINP